MQYLSIGMELIIISPNSTWLPSKMTLTLLGKESKKFWARPSDRIYFGRYPYKIKLDFNELISEAVREIASNHEQIEFTDGTIVSVQDHWAYQIQRWREIDKLKDMILQLELFEMERFYCNVDAGHITVYVKTKKYYTKILKALAEHVILVQGPWNKKHRDMLVDPVTTLVVRQKPFWGKYDIKIEIQPRGASYNRWSGHVKRKEYMEDALSFIKGSMKEDAVRISTRTYWYGSCWTNDKDLDPILPFMKIAYPNLRLHTYRCFYFK